MPYVITAEPDENAILLHRDQTLSHVICEVYPQNEHGVIAEDVEAMRLARLFAGAEELLAACEICISYWEGESRLNVADIKRRVLAAVSKAKGE